MATEEAHIDELDQYLEVFYEDDIERKILASRKVLLLLLDVKNLEELLNHESFLGTISRTLKDEFKKNMDLCIYLLCSFYMLSNYNQFHPYLLQNQIGDTSIKILEYQLQRFDMLFSEWQEKHKKANSQELRADLDRYVKKFNVTLFKQDKIFFILLTILLNLAEDFGIENKMKKRKISVYLVKMLDRNNLDLLIISLVFLKKLSIFSENKDQMIEEGIAKKMGRFLNSNNPILTQLALRLMVNLSFDTKFKLAVDAEGLLPKVVELLKSTQFRAIVLCLLYLLSLDDRIRDSLAATECYHLVYQLMIHFPEPILGRELIALAINLSANKKNAELLSVGDMLPNIIKRAFKTGDLLLFKFIRNISQFAPDNSRDVVNGAVPEFLKLLLNKNRPDDLKLEVVGILTNAHLGEDWMQFLKNNAFLEFLENSLATETTEEDLILDNLQLINRICENPKCTEFLYQTKIIKVLPNLLLEKQEDDEFVYMVLRIVHKFLLADVAVSYIINQSKIMEFCLDLVDDKNKQIRAINGDILDIVMEYDDNLAEKIKEKKFIAHNKIWIESMQQEDPAMYAGEGYMEGGVDYQEEMLNPRMWDSDSEVD